MSFNLASLIAGTKTKEIKNEKGKEVMKKKAFTHGLNVIFNHGTYKGYHGFVSDFFPASITLMVSGRAYVEAQKYGPIVNVGSHIITDMGDSEVEQVLLVVGGEYVPIQLFKSSEDNKLRVGRVITDDNLIMNYLMKKGRDMAEVKNTFVMEITLMDDSIVSGMSRLSMDEMTTLSADVLAEKLTKMQINAEMPSLLERLSQEIKTNVSLLDKIIHPEYFVDDLVMRMVMKKDLVGPRYYMNVSNNLGDIKMYNPSKAHYLVAYKKRIIFRPNMITIESEALKEGETAFQIKYPKDFIERLGEVKMTSEEMMRDNLAENRYFGVVNTGMYKGKRFEVVDYTAAHLAVTLFTNGRTVTSHVVRKRSKDGRYIIDEYGNPVFETSLIYPSDVFYLDILLNNGNYAQVNKVLPDNSIIITEKDTKTNTFIRREISQDEIQEMQPGFKLGGMEAVVEKDEEEYMIAAQPELVSDSVDMEGEESEEEEIGVMSPVVEMEDETPARASFKDIQRTSVVQRELTSQEKKLRDEIVNVLRLLKISDESVDIYSTIDIIMSIVKDISGKVKSIGYKTDIMVTSNMKFIIVCVVLYELIKQNFEKDMNEVISILFPSYFTIKDIQAQSMNENVFLMRWNDNLNEDRIKESIGNIREFRKSEGKYMDIIKEIMINADRVLQKMLGIRVNIIQRVSSTKDLIALGVNPLTGRRYKEEMEEKALMKSREALMRLKSQQITVDDLINEVPLPIEEVQVVWGQVNMPILDKFKQELEKKMERDVALRQEYEYIKDNLVRAPFAIRDDIMKPAVRKTFDSIYKTLLATIIKRGLKVESGKKRRREEKEQVMLKRAEIAAKRPREEEEEEVEEDKVQHTASYIREQKKREMQSAIARATRAANRAAYATKKKEVSETE